MIPYSRQQIDEDDIAAVISALRSPYLTTGPCVDRFETAFAEFVGSRHAISVNSGTAALHTALACSGVVPGDEVIVPALTFAATANVIVHAGATPVFADVDPDTLLVDPISVRSAMTPRTRLIVAVDYAGQPCPYNDLRQIAEEQGLALLADSCHSLGASYRDRPVGSIADATAFSFHAVKPITTAEGGMITTDDPSLAERMARFRNHGIDRDCRQRQREQGWAYDIERPGFNYRLSDLQSALGLSQLTKCRSGMKHRNQIAAQYRRRLQGHPHIHPLRLLPGLEHAYHLFVVRIRFQEIGITRAELFRSLHKAGVRVNVHYQPVHLLRFYQDQFGTRPGLCPNAEQAFREIVSLPVYAGLELEQADEVLNHLFQLVPGNARFSKSGRPDRKTANLNLNRVFVES